MNIVVAMDSFKGSLTTFEAGTAVKAGIKKVLKDANVIVVPVADGGEGTVSTIVKAAKGKFVKTYATNPIGDKIVCRYGILPKTKTAVIEMAAAAGITLIDESQKNPLITTTFGVGEIIKDAIERGCRKFIIGVGGGATNDGAIGMLQALGFKFLNKNGEDVPFGAGGLDQIYEIQTDSCVKELKDCEFVIACDVQNPLLGKNGCSEVYGPQKGATPEMIKQMENGLKNYAKLTKKVIKNADENYPGSGAMGGAGFACMAYLNATLKPGIEIVIDEIGLENIIENADLVITGEGRLDAQTLMGKAPVGIAKLAKKHNKQVFAFAGLVEQNEKNFKEKGIDEVFSISKLNNLTKNMISKKEAAKNLQKTVEQVFGLIKMNKKEGNI